jgi:hypothetical protein
MPNHPEPVFHLDKTTTPAKVRSTLVFAQSRLLQVPLMMKNVYEVLRQKELELARLEKEVEALRVAAPLLSEEKEPMAMEATNNKPTLASSSPLQPAMRIPQPAMNNNPQPARAAGWEDTGKRWP